jgi:hypothetical protein
MVAPSWQESRMQCVCPSYRMVNRDRLRAASTPGKFVRARRFQKPSVGALLS